ncbi:BamA/TamA family outer membrane protein [Shimia sp.]|uniref:BamA/TamA family outer membrane protein n=1 Tax=Shimia sp. TaxID=1954381 RepID=UPI003298675F
MIADASEREDDYGLRTGSFMVAPIPFKNPTIGAGLALGGAYLFQFDAESDTSHFAIGGLRSDNGTNGYGLSGSLSWGANTWKLDATLAQAEAYYDLYVGGVPVGLKQDGSLFTATLLRGVSENVLVGGTLRYLETTVGLESGGILPPGVVQDANLTLGNLGFVGQYDSRDDTLYPRSGYFVDFELLGGTTLEGSARDYARSFANMAGYWSLGEKTVVASQLSTCAATSDTPFFDQCALGGIDAFRGFSATQYYDTSSVSLQVELRQKFGSRFGAVAFAGAGMTGPDFSSLDAGGVHTAAGFGMRFQLTKKFETDFSVDVSFNDEDEQLVYIYVGQRF